MPEQEEIKPWYMTQEWEKKKMQLRHDIEQSYPPTPQECRP